MFGEAQMRKAVPWAQIQELHSLYTNSIQTFIQ